MHDMAHDSLVTDTARARKGAKIRSGAEKNLAFESSLIRPRAAECVQGKHGGGSGSSALIVDACSARVTHVQRGRPQ